MESKQFCFESQVDSGGARSAQYAVGTAIEERAAAHRFPALLLSLAPNVVEFCMVCVYIVSEVTCRYSRTKSEMIICHKRNDYIQGVKIIDQQQQRTVSCWTEAKHGCHFSSFPLSVWWRLSCCLIYAIFSILLN
jgi:hypothetical protein